MEDRFWPRVQRDDDSGCWVWTGSLVHDGYGEIYDGQRQVRVHRYAYELLVGPIPEGLQLDHLCRNRGCVNPGHLEPVSARANTLRGTAPTAANAAKTHCIRGHALTADNLFTSALPRRACKACSRIQSEKRTAQRSSR